MSHNIHIKDVKIMDLSALDSAVSALRSRGVNISLDKTATTFRTYSGQVNVCSAAILLPDSNHDVGLIEQTDGSYSLVFDPYGGGINHAVGVVGKSGTKVSVSDGYANPLYHVGLLLQEYSAAVLETEAALQGLYCTREYSEDTGKLNVIIER